MLVDRDPRAVLDAINDRAISRLLVPDADPVHVEHQWKEPASARERVVTAFGRRVAADTHRSPRPEALIPNPLT